eukprot:1162039-Pelagomonas_calceolata.AAC.10
MPASGSATPHCSVNVSLKHACRQIWEGCDPCQQVAVLFFLPVPVTFPLRHGSRQVQEGCDLCQRVMVTNDWTFSSVTGSKRWQWLPC